MRKIIVVLIVLLIPAMLLVGCGRDKKSYLINVEAKHVESIVLKQNVDLSYGASNGGILMSETGKKSVTITDKAKIIEFIAKFNKVELKTEEYYASGKNFARTHNTSFNNYTYRRADMISVKVTTRKRFLQPSNTYEFGLGALYYEYQTENGKIQNAKQTKDDGHCFRKGKTNMTPVCEGKPYAYGLSFFE